MSGPHTPGVTSRKDANFLRLFQLLGHSIVCYNALVFFHEDDTARAQKTDCDGGTIYFLAREPYRPHDPPVS